MIDGWLNLCHRACPMAQPLSAFPGLDPDARHFGIDLAISVCADATARPVSQTLGAVHRARHARRGQHALTAHAAIEQSALGYAFDGCHRSLETFEPDPPQQRCRPHQHALKGHINPLKKPRVAHAPKTESKLARPPGPFSYGLECGRHSGEASHHSAIRANETCQQNEGERAIGSPQAVARNVSIPPRPVSLTTSGRPRRRAASSAFSRSIQSGI